jgi:hypothetical protein
MHRPEQCLLPLVCQRLLPQAAAADSADTLPLVPVPVLPQAAAAGTADSLPVVRRQLLRETGHRSAQELRALVSLRADQSALAVEAARFTRVGGHCAY